MLAAITSGSSQTDSTKNTCEGGDEMWLREPGALSRTSIARGSGSGSGTAVPVTLKAFSLAKFKIRSRLSRVVLVASNTWRKYVATSKFICSFETSPKQAGFQPGSQMPWAAQNSTDINPHRAFS